MRQIISYTEISAVSDKKNEPHETDKNYDW
jgi:hypothetical protein